MDGFIMEYPIKMDDLGYHYFRKHPYLTGWFFERWIPKVCVNIPPPRKLRWAMERLTRFFDIGVDTSIRKGLGEFSTDVR